MDANPGGRMTCNCGAEFHNPNYHATEQEAKDSKMRYMKTTVVCQACGEHIKAWQTYGKEKSE